MRPVPTRFPAQALHIALGQALLLIVKGETPKVENQTVDNDGNVWHAHASFVADRKGVKLFKREKAFGLDARVTEYFIPLGAIQNPTFMCYEIGVSQNDQNGSIEIPIEDRELVVTVNA